MEDSFGRMLELNRKGSRTEDAGREKERKYLDDGDTVAVRDSSCKPLQGRVDFGARSGVVLPTGTPEPNEAPESPNYRNTPESPNYRNFKLYSYFHSSSSWRVHIALAAKNIPYEVIHVDILNGEHKKLDFLAKSPLGQVPVLEFEDSKTGALQYLTQSVAIIGFLEDCFPMAKSIIPEGPLEKAVAQEMVELINSGIQPLQNIPLLRNLEKMSEGRINAQDFGQGVIFRGLEQVQKLIETRKDETSGHVGPYSLGTFSPTIVDVYLVPQLHNARRFGLDPSKEFDTLANVEKTCSSHPWFALARSRLLYDKSS